MAITFSTTRLVSTAVCATVGATGFYLFNKRAKAEKALQKRIDSQVRYYATLNVIEGIVDNAK